MNYGASHSESFATLMTRNRNKHSTFFLNIFSCTFGTGYGCENLASHPILSQIRYDNHLLVVHTCSDSYTSSTQALLNKYKFMAEWELWETNNELLAIITSYDPVMCYMYDKEKCFVQP